MPERRRNPIISFRRASIRTVALPAEHGGWGFLLEPIVLGLLVAFSWRGVALGLAALFVFLIHQPMRLALKDIQKRRTVPRTGLAIRFAVGYGVLALIFILLAGLGSNPVFIVPLVMALPLAAFQSYSDIQSQSRSLTAELSGSVALGASAASIALLNGWDFKISLVLWLITILRTVPSIYYVRARLRVERGQKVSLTYVILSHIASLLIGRALVINGLAPTITLLALVVLSARAALGLSRYRKPAQAKQVGFRELAFGIAYVVLIAAAW